MAGTNPERILNGMKEMMTKEIGWKNPFEDGTASQKIIAILSKQI